MNITIPVLNEERTLTSAVEKVFAYTRTRIKNSCEIVIASNGSTDRTVEIAKELQQTHPILRIVDLPNKGRGGALRHAWGESSADVLSYMDCDLSTDLACFQPLIAPLLAGTHDIAIGSRLCKESVTRRGFKRSLISKSYNAIVKALFDVTFCDAQCGFKAISRKAFCDLSPMIKDDGWFFDTELLLVAEKFGYPIYELPVRWIESSDSKVRIMNAIFQDLKGLLRMKRAMAQQRKIRGSVPARNE